jgi:hypothetical protein
MGSVGRFALIVTPDRKTRRDYPENHHAATGNLFVTVSR